MNNETPFGIKVDAELFGISYEKLNSVDLINKEMEIAAKKSGVNILNSNFHKFEPQGVTGYLMLSTSHMSIHTWPESGYANIEMYTCGGKNPDPAILHMIHFLEPKSGSITRRNTGYEKMLPIEMYNIEDYVRIFGKVEI